MAAVPLSQPSRSHPRRGRSVVHALCIVLLSLNVAPFVAHLTHSLNRDPPDSDSRQTGSPGRSRESQNELLIGVSCASSCE